MQYGHWPGGTRNLHRTKQDFPPRTSFPEGSENSADSGRFPGFPVLVRLPVLNQILTFGFATVALLWTAPANYALIAFEWRFLCSIAVLGFTVAGPLQSFTGIP